MRPYGLLVLAAGLAVVVSVGQQPDWAARVQERAAKARELATQLRRVNATEAEGYTREFRDKLTSQFSRLLREQVLDTLTETDSDLSAVRRALRLFGPSAQPEMPETDAVAGALPFPLPGSPVVIITFLLASGPAEAHETKVFIQAYRKAGSLWEFADETGNVLDNHGLYLWGLMSPRKEQVWVFAHGSEPTPRPRKTRLRVYSFDGQKFATEWSPADRLDATVLVSGGKEILITSTDDSQPIDPHRPPLLRHERFLLSGSSGVIQAPLLPSPQ